MKRNNPLFPLQCTRRKIIGLSICAWDVTINNDNVYINYIVNRTWISYVIINNDNVYINYIVSRFWIYNVTINNEKVYINYIVNRTWISNVTIKWLTMFFLKREDFSQSNLLILAVGLLVVFALREYILKFTYSSVLNINYTRSEILVSCFVYIDQLLF